MGLIIGHWTGHVRLTGCELAIDSQCQQKFVSLCQEISA